MKTYVDANALIRLYLDFDGSGQARDLVTASKVRRHWPLPVPPLLLFEVSNGLQRMVFESRTGGQWTGHAGSRRRGVVRIHRRISNRPRSCSIRPSRSASWKPTSNRSSPATRPVTVSARTTSFTSPRREPWVARGF